MGITNYVKGQSFHQGGFADALLVICSTEDQAIAEAGTAQPITFNIHGAGDLVGFEHDTVVDNHIIVMPRGVNLVLPQLELQVNNGASNNTLSVHAEISVDGGPWFAVANTGTHAVMSPNTSLVLSHSRIERVTASPSQRASVRLMMVGDSTNLSLSAHDPADGVPGIPSAVLLATIR